MGGVDAVPGIGLGELDGGAIRQPAYLRHTIGAYPYHAAPLIIYFYALERREDSFHIGPERFDIFASIEHMTFPGGPVLRSPILAAGMLYHRFKDLF